MPLTEATLRRGLQAFLKDDGGATAIEYGLIAAATGSVVAAAMDPIQNSALWEVFNQITEQMIELTNQ